MSTVFEAIDPTLNRRVALKVLREGEASAKLIHRLHAEAAAVAQLRHPNIVTIHEVGESTSDDGQKFHFIAMDYIEGSTLAEAAALMSRRERVLTMETIARAVAHAHAQGIVHRDLKPHNVLIDSARRSSTISSAHMKKSDITVATRDAQPHLYLSDFGLARVLEGHDLTRTGVAMGTPYYMAPEQVRGLARETGPRTDVWALGVMLYELLAGGLPFAGKTVPDVYQGILFSDAPRMVHGVPADLQTVCMKALEKNPAERYVSADAFADDLHRWLRDEPIQARPISAMQFLARRLRRHRSVAIAACALALLIAGAAALLVAQSDRDRRALAAEQNRNQRRESALLKLSAQWSIIIERKRELRQLAVPAVQASAELERAVRAVDDHVRGWPDEPQGYYVRARGHMYMNDLPAAEKDIRAALDGHPTFRPGWSLLGVLRVEAYTRGIYETGRKDPSYLLEAQGAFEKGSQPGCEQEEAKRWRLAWTREDQIMERVGRALRLWHIEHRVADAANVLAEGLNEYRAEEYASWMGAIAANLDDQISWETRAIEWAPGFDKAIMDRAELRFRSGDLVGALSDYDRALELNPRSGPAFSNRGLIRKKHGDLNGAREDYDRALALNPNDTTVYNNRGQLKLDSGDLDGALLDLTRAIELDATNFQAHANRGSLHARRKANDLAIADFTRAIEINPMYAKAYTNRAFVWHEMGNFPRTIADLEKALETAEPDWPGRERTARDLETLRARVRQKE